MKFISFENADQNNDKLKFSTTSLILTLKPETKQWKLKNKRIKIVYKGGE